jgi:hypothetical protein
VTTSSRAAVSSTGEMRPCEMGMPIVTLQQKALTVPMATQAISLDSAMGEAKNIAKCHAPKHS